jgi:hypothetical protein
LIDVTFAHDSSQAICELTCCPYHSVSRRMPQVMSVRLRFSMFCAVR